MTFHISICGFFFFHSNGVGVCSIQAEAEEAVRERRLAAEHAQRLQLECDRANEELRGYSEKVDCDFVFFLF